MRIKLLLLLTACLLGAGSVYGQKTNVAVYVHGNASSEEKKVVSQKFTSAIVQSSKYAAIERTADFLAELRREYGYQYSGQVDDGQIITLGKHFGVKLVCVVNVSKRARYSTQYNTETAVYFIIAARMIDVETGLAVSAEGEYDFCVKGSCSNANYYFDNIPNSAAKTAEKLLQNVTVTAGKQKMAIYVTQSSNTYNAKCVSSALIENFTKSDAFITVERTSDFLAGLRREQTYQQSGQVDDNQLSRLGRQWGVNMVCVVDVVNVQADRGEDVTYLAVRIINAETGVIMATAESKGWGGCDCQCTRSCDFMWQENVSAMTTVLLNQMSVCAKKDQKATENFMSCCEGLTKVNGVCRDCSGSAYWVSDLGIEVMAKDIKVERRDVTEDKCKACPEGWRMPTKAEFERMLTQRAELNFSGKTRYITSDYSARKDKRDVYYYYECYVHRWETVRLYNLSYPKKRGNPERYDYNEFYYSKYSEEDKYSISSSRYEKTYNYPLYVRCVKD